MWSLRGLSSSLEFPFKLGPFGEDAIRMQDEFNGQLLLILSSYSHIVPVLPDDFDTAQEEVRSETLAGMRDAMSVLPGLEVSGRIGSVRLSALRRVRSLRRIRSTLSTPDPLYAEATQSPSSTRSDCAPRCPDVAALPDETGMRDAMSELPGLKVSGRSGSVRLSNPGGTSTPDPLSAKATQQTPSLTLSDCAPRCPDVAALPVETVGGALPWECLQEGDCRPRSLPNVSQIPPYQPGSQEESHAAIRESQADKRYHPVANGNPLLDATSSIREVGLTSTGSTIL